MIERKYERSPRHRQMWETAEQHASFEDTESSSLSLPQFLLERPPKQRRVLEARQGFGVGVWGLGFGGVEARRQACVTRPKDVMGAIGL